MKASRMAILAVLGLMVCSILLSSVPLVNSSTTLNLYCHQETTTIAGENYYQLKNDVPGDGGDGIVLSYTTDNLGTFLLGKFVYPLSDVVIGSTIGPSRLYFFYRVSHSTSGDPENPRLASHFETQILIREFDGSVRDNLGTIDTVGWAGNFDQYGATQAEWDMPSYTGVVSTDYLEIDYYDVVTYLVESNPPENVTLSLYIDNEYAPLDEQTKVTNWLVSPPPPPSPPPPSGTYYNLTTSVVGQGSVSPPGTTSWGSGSAVSVIATATANGWFFDYWAGDASGTQNPLTVTMDSNKSVTAYFTQTPPSGENRPPIENNENTPFLPPPTPTSTNTPWWLWLLLLVSLCVLEAAIMKEDSWDRARQGWTFVWNPGSAMAVLVLAALALVGIYSSFGLSEVLYIYLGLLGIGVVAFGAAQLKSKFPAYIDLGKDGELTKLAVGGAVMGAIWLLFSGLMSDWLGATYTIKSIVPWLNPMSLAMGVGFVGFLAPLIEEQAFHQTIAPSIASGFGPVAGAFGSGIAAGVAHFIFSGCLALAVSATGFFAVVGYFVLRHQGAIYGYSAHITYNLLVIAITVLLVVGI